MKPITLHTQPNSDAVEGPDTWPYHPEFDPMEWTLVSGRRQRNADTGTNVFQWMFQGRMNHDRISVTVEQVD